MHDRYLSNGARLWQHVQRQPAGCVETVEVRPQRTRGNQVKRRGRTARVTVRHAPVELPPPCNDPRTRGEAPIQAWAVYAVEEDPPPGEEPLEWMLLTSEPVQSDTDAKRCLQWYGCRWVIEMYQSYCLQCHVLYQVVSLGLGRVKAAA